MASFSAGRGLKRRPEELKGAFRLIQMALGSSSGEVAGAPLEGAVG